MALRLHLFGTCRVVGPAGVLCGRVARPRQLAFLALAAVPPGGTTRDRIGSYLWPQSASADARHLVADTLHLLRKHLGGGALRSVGESICIDGSRVSCDLREFRSARAAGEWERMLELYEGPFLDGFHGAGGAELERWTDNERLRCAEVALLAVRKLVARCEARGRISRAVEWLRRGRAVDPFDEGITRELMRLLALTGDRAAAVRAYRTLRRRLSTELDLAPSPATRAVHDAIVAGEGADGPRTENVIP